MPFRPALLGWWEIFEVGGGGGTQSFDSFAKDKEEVASSRVQQMRTSSLKSNPTGL